MQDLRTRPNNTVLDEISEYLSDWLRQAAAKAARDAEQWQIDQSEVENSQKEVIERLRDRNWPAW